MVNPRLRAKALTVMRSDLANGMGDDTLNEIQQTHGGLRESIATTKRFVDESDHLIRKHREGTGEGG